MRSAVSLVRPSKTPTMLVTSLVVAVVFVSAFAAPLVEERTEEPYGNF